MEGTFPRLLEGQEDNGIAVARDNIERILLEQQENDQEISMEKLVEALSKVKMQNIWEEIQTPEEFMEEKKLFMLATLSCVEDCSTPKHRVVLQYMQFAYRPVPYILVLMLQQYKPVPVSEIPCYKHKCPEPILNVSNQMKTQILENMLFLHAPNLALNLNRKERRDVPSMKIVNSANKNFIDETELDMLLKHASESVTMVELTILTYFMQINFVNDTKRIV
ncbi:hypothetical protein ILUMI_09311 [Ignelater luminosus]|uniref:Uncharacterized protein n=1 Tax=Ignelater luminosus TaxID=2038154 RepID=A0A8K0GCJ8_IGNLU|nr:hypothetical protein ILUMI_09311 [Ignelater luminosus]